MNQPTDDNIPVGKKLIVADSATKLFVGGIGLTTSEMARCRQPISTQDFLARLEKVLQAAYQDVRNSRKVLQGLTGLQEMLRQTIERLAVFGKLATASTC